MAINGLLKIIIIVNGRRLSHHNALLAHLFRSRSPGHLHYMNGSSLCFPGRTAVIWVGFTKMNGPRGI